MLTSTYLNKPMQPIYMQNQMPYTGYSPNTRVTGGQQFFAQPVNPIQMTSGMGFHAQMKVSSQTFMTPQQQIPTQINTPIVQINQPLSNTSTGNTTATTTSDNKKILFNKDAQIFVPKSMRKEGDEKPNDRKISENVERTTDKTKNEDFQVMEEKEIEVIQTTPIESLTTNNTEKTITNIETIPRQVVENEAPFNVEPSTVQTIENEEKSSTTTSATITSTTSTTEAKKNERPSKLKDLFGDNSKTPGPAAKNNAAKKSISTTSTSTGVIVPNKLKVNDVQKSLEEKRKLLLLKQKEEKNKFYVAPTTNLKKQGIYKLIKIFNIFRKNHG
jgi:hypothetical protein